MNTDIHRKLILINAAAIFFQSANKVAVILKHLGIEAQQMIVLINCIFQLNAK